MKFTLGLAFGMGMGMISLTGIHTTRHEQHRGARLLYGSYIEGIGRSVCISSIG